MLRVLGDTYTAFVRALPAIFWFGFQTWFGAYAEAGIEMLRQEGRKAVEEDDAEAILLGCASMAEFADSLEQELGVPVIDGVVAGVKFAEAIVDLGKKTSKLKTYKFPEKKEFVGILNQFGSLVK
jgi:allantoin racemase